jgi:deoxyribose-phosphate aldolase
MSQSPARHELARLIEHTLRKANATRAEVERLCAEARTHGFAGVRVSGSRVAQAAHFLDGTDVKVTCAVAFPNGDSDADVKRYETEAAVDSGAHFIEVTLNHGRLKDGDDAYVLRELRDVVEAADERPVSVRLDAGLLTEDEIRRVGQLVVEASVKEIALAGERDQATLLGTVRLLRKVSGRDIGIKADRTVLALDEIIALLDAGVTRFGFEESVKLIEGLR